MPEQGDRFPRDQEFHKDEGDRELYPKPDSDPDAYDVISPSLVTIDWPSFDLTSRAFGEAASKAYLSYMLQRGPRTFEASLETEREGFLACDFQVRTTKGPSTWDTWDYHGPLSVKVQSTFSDEPFKKVPEGIQAALQACFAAGGYEETSEEMQPFEEFLSPLKLSMKHRLLGFRAKPLVIPIKGGKLASMREADFVRAVLEAHPEIYIYWREEP